MPVSVSLVPIAARLTISCSLLAVSSALYHAKQVEAEVEANTGVRSPTVGMLAPADLNGRQESVTSALYHTRQADNEEEFIAEKRYRTVGMLVPDGIVVGELEAGLPGQQDGVISLLSDLVTDGQSRIDPSLQAHWRRFPHGIVASSLSHHINLYQEPAHRTIGPGRGNHFGYIMLVGFFALVVLHYVANRVRDCETHGGPELEARAPWKPEPAPQLPAGQTLRERTSAVLWLLGWMACSAVFVIYNKWLFTKGGFPHPIYLTTFHMATCFVVFWLLRTLAPAALRQQIMPDAEKVIPWTNYITGLFPIALLYGYCLGAGNLAFMYSSVAFLQMIKPINVLFTSLAAFAFMLETATWSHVIIVCVIFGGVSLAAAGDVEFSIVGCALQLSACLGEGIRLALLQKVMTKDMRLDPVTTVYRFAPVAGLALCATACLVERPVDWGAVRSPPLLALNCLVALALNILIVTVIKKTSAVVFTLGGIVKDIGAICASVAIFSTPIAWLEIIGYAVSMCGIVMFKCYKDNIDEFKKHGFVGGFAHVARSISAKAEAGASK